MTNKEILAKAIKKAMENGYKLPKWMYNPKSIENVGSAIIRCNYLEKLLFDHDFAKAFWGERKDYCVLGGERCKGVQHMSESGCSTYDIPRWQYHIKELALAKDRFSYLEQFLGSIGEGKPYNN